MRSTFYPLLGDRVWGGTGDVIDTLAVVATIFGLATSMGLGAQQAAGGIAYLAEIGGGLQSQILIIIGVTIVAIFSVVRGIDGGVKLLSNVNMVLALLLLLFVIFAGTVSGMFSNLDITFQGYVQSLLPLSNPVGRDDDTFYHSWTIFYWAWWISWSPFVGMFIARVSRGRTVREFMIAVLLVPTIVSALWMTTFGGSAINQLIDRASEAAVFGYVIESYTPELSLFAMLSELPLATITSFIGVVLVIVFFVTSSDSGSLVIDTITAGGKVNAPVSQRVFWCTFEGLVAIALLLGGGLGALQAAAVSTGFPFAVILLLACYALFKGLYSEPRGKAAATA